MVQTKAIREQQDFPKFFPKDLVIWEKHGVLEVANPRAEVCPKLFARF
jgi:hypothetical protein